jgi:hypothetical protein
MATELSAQAHRSTEQYAWATLPAETRDLLKNAVVFCLLGIIPLAISIVSFGNYEMQSTTAIFGGVAAAGLFILAVGFIRDFLREVQQP